MPPAVLRRLQIDQGDQDGHDQSHRGHGGRELRHDGQRDLRQGERGVLPNGSSEGPPQGRVLLQGGDRDVPRQLDVSTDLLDLGTEPNPWWSEGVQREHRQEVHQLAMEQPMWKPEEEVSIEEPPAIDDADASQELETLQRGMGRVGAQPTSWSTTRRGVALQTQEAMPNEEGDLRAGHHRGVGRDLQGEHHRGVEDDLRAGHHRGVGRDQSAGHRRGAGRVNVDEHRRGAVALQTQGALPDQEERDLWAGHRRGVGQGRQDEHRRGVERDLSAEHHRGAGQGQQDEVLKEILVLSTTEVLDKVNKMNTAEVLKDVFVLSTTEVLDGIKVKSAIEVQVVADTKEVWK